MKPDRETPYEKEDYLGDLNMLSAEKVLIIRAYKRCKGVKKQMAKELNINLRTLHYKVVLHGLGNIFPYNSYTSKCL